MLIQNVKIYIDRAFVNGSVRFGTLIEDCGEFISPKENEQYVDAHGGYLIPGLIDIHTHGAVRNDSSDGSADGLEAMGRYYAAGGVTSWCPTTMTLSEDILTHAMTAIKNYTRAENGAKIAGVNLEGPFLSEAKKGAQAQEFLKSPDIEMFKRLNDASGGKIRLVTVAPELDGAIDFIRQASKICTVSLGHTAADYDISSRAFDAGASHVTHLFNAMNPIHHREPGLVCAARDFGATAEIICDGVHVHPSAVRLAFDVFREKMVIISDSLRCAGVLDESYSFVFGGQSVSVCGKKAVLTGTDTLAGSAVHLMDELRLAVKFGISLENAVYAVTEAPANVIGNKNIGKIKKGLAADMVLLDNDLNIKSIYIDGREILCR